MTRRMLAGVLVAFAVGLSGCTVHRSIVATRAQTQLVGMSKVELLSCAGAPVRQERAEEFEFLTFVGGGDSMGYGVATFTSPNTAIATGKSARRYCEATFVLKGGIVQKVNYQGRTGGLLTRGEQCAFIVENCVK